MAKNVPIEHFFEQIEGAIEALEDGELPLEDALKRYEDGLKSVREAKVLLDSFEAKIEELQGKLAVEQLSYLDGDSEADEPA
ncbi:MAG: exodeoxyribonuclease VII small subunit [Planctomycetota bacterium]|jgi:exodeoxyribonuclease VII small subunit|nr:exodeoxyribonuclease VII small subunit [Planctomycetota bacterium]